MWKIFFLLVSFAFGSYAQIDSTKAFKIAIASEVAIYGGTMYGLNKLWYADYERSSFHFHNDNSHWFKIDKYGHAYSVYNLSKLGNNILLSSGVPKKKSLWYGGMFGPVMLTTVEILDGFSKQWGASYGDLVANTIGSIVYVGQELLWEEQRVQMKFSFFPTAYAKENSNILGSNFLEQTFKDYNGQTYWISANISSFFKNSSIPQPLCISLGYGIDNLISSNAYTDLSSRQYYLSLDLDLNKIKTNSEFLNKVFMIFNHLKIPLPAIMLNKNKLTFYPLHYGQ